MVKLKRKTLILAKLESVYGTDPTPTAADNAILTLDADVKETFEQAPRDTQVATLTRQPLVGAKRYAEVTMQVEFSGSGAAGTAPRIGTLLQACSMSETVVSGTSVTYKPTSSSQKSITLYVYKDGVMHEVNGAMGTFKVTNVAGSQSLFDFTFKGIYNTAVDDANPSATYDTNVDSPPLCVSAALTYNSTSFYVNETTLDIQNNVAMRPSINAATAIAGFFVSDRNPIGTFDPEAESVSTYDFNADVLGGGEELTYNVGSVAGNKYTLTVPKFNITDLAYADRESVLVKSVTGQCAYDSAGDDEFEIVCT